MNGKNWKVKFDKGDGYTYVSGRVNGRFRKKETVILEARKQTKYMFLGVSEPERTTIEEDQNLKLWESK